MNHFTVGTEDDDDTVSTASTKITMWETLLNVIGSAVTTKEQNCDLTRDNDAIDADDNDRTQDFSRSKVSMKSLTLPIVVCLTFPLVGVVFLSVQHTELGEHGNVISSREKGDIRLGKIIEEPIDKSGSEETMLDDSSQLLLNDSVAEVSVDEMLEEFLSAMSTDWCALDEEPMMCFDDYAHGATVENNLTEQASYVDVMPNSAMSDNVHLASNTSHSTTHTHLPKNYGVELLATPTIKTASNYSDPILNVEFNPHFLQFNIRVNIRYESILPFTKFPTFAQHSVMVFPQEKLRAHSERKVLDVHCPNNQIECNTSSIECPSEPQVLDCHSQVNYRIGFQSLLEGFNDTDFSRNQYFVVRTIRFILIREERMVDHWDVIAKVPMENDEGQERWLRGHFASVYTADLRDTIIVEPETTSASPSMAFSWNESLSYSPVIKEQADSQGYSENQGGAENQELEWEKLLIGCFSGMAVGLLLLFAPVFKSKVIRLVSDRELDGPRLTERDHCSKDDKMVAVDPNFNASLPRKSRLNTGESMLERETIQHASRYQHTNDPPQSEFELGRESRHFEDVSSLPPVYPRQNQRIARKKMYSRQFETDLQHSKTPRRGNLKSSRQPDTFLNDDVTEHVQTETSGLRMIRESRGTLAEENISTEQGNDAIFYSPKYDANPADVLPHSNTLSSPEETTESSHQDVIMSESSIHESEVSEHHPETISPPTIMRIIDPLPFSNPPPFPPSKATPSTEHHGAPTQSQEGMGCNDESQYTESETLLFVENQDIASPTIGDVQQEESHNESEHTSRSPKGKNRDEIDEIGASTELKSTACSDSTPKSPAFSNATFTHDNDIHTADSNVVDDASSATKVIDQADKDASSANVSDKLHKGAKCLTSQTMPFVPSPRKKLRRSVRKHQADRSQSSVPIIAAATTDTTDFTSQNVDMPLTEERPVSRRCGAPGQNKRFAASSSASDELSFKSDSTFHDCGGERIGQRVAKNINGVTCFGTVTEYDGRDSPEIWRVSYDDGSTHREYYQREQLLEVIMHYKVHEKNDPKNENLDDDFGEIDSSSWQSSESQESDRSDDTWAKKEKRAREKKRARAERRLLRTARKPAIHKPSTALIPLSQAMDEPVWKFS